MKKTLILSTIAAAVALTGCGSSSSDTVSTTEQTGYFVDSAVENVDYDCVVDGTSGTTDAQGAFHCKTMSQVRFRLGNLLLGEIDALPQDGFVFPQDLAGVTRNDLNDTRVLELAQLLQSLDSDGNVSNGIQINDAIKEELPDEDFEAVDDAETLLESISQTIHTRTESEAQEHLRETLQSIHTEENGNGHNENRQGGQHGNGNSNGGDTHDTTDQNMIDVDSYEMYELSDEVKETLAYMGNEERLAYDLYHNLYNHHAQNGTEIKQLNNIAENSESKHIQIVQSLVRKYDLDGSSLVANPVADSTVSKEEMPSGQYGIEAIQNLYDALYEKGVQSAQDALEVGCMVEVTDINDLNEDIALAESIGAQDVIDAYNILRNGSYNHYWAFDKGLKNMGVETGCCSLGTIDGVDYCHTEYPKNENKGTQNGNAPHGQGEGRNRNDMR